MQHPAGRDRSQTPRQPAPTGRKPKNPPTGRFGPEHLRSSPASATPKARGPSSRRRRPRAQEGDPPATAQELGLAASSTQEPTRPSHQPTTNRPIAASSQQDIQRQQSPKTRPKQNPQKPDAPTNATSPTESSAECGATKPPENNPNPSPLDKGASDRPSKLREVGACPLVAEDVCCRRFSGDALCHAPDSCRWVLAQLLGDFSALSGPLAGLQDAREKGSRQVRTLVLGESPGQGRVEGVRTG